MPTKISDSEQAATLAMLKAQAAPAAFPGSAPARLHGRYATLAIGVSSPQLIPAALLCFHWEVEFNMDFADATAHGDFWRVRIPLTQDWQGRVQGYMTRAGTSYLAAISDNTSNGGIGADPLGMTLTLYNDAGTHAFFAGACFGQRGRVIKPMAMVTQELELVASGPPTIITAA